MSLKVAKRKISLYLTKDLAFKGSLWTQFRLFPVALCIQDHQTICRRIQQFSLVLEEEGADQFFEPRQFDFKWLLKQNLMHLVVLVSISLSAKLFIHQKLYSTFDLMLSVSFETLPEVGDPESQNRSSSWWSASSLQGCKQLFEKVEQVVRLIAWCVGIYLHLKILALRICLAQLAQHALRAYTPKEGQICCCLKFSSDPDFDGENSGIYELGQGSLCFSWMIRGKLSVVERLLFLLLLNRVFEFLKMREHWLDHDIAFFPSPKVCDDDWSGICLWKLNSQQARKRSARRAKKLRKNELQEKQSKTQSGSSKKI